MAQEKIHREDLTAKLFADPTSYQDLDSWHAEAKRLRHEEPFPRIQAESVVPFRAATRHADIIAIERNHRVFLNTRDSVLFPIEEMEKNRSLGVDIKTLIHMDNPEHREYRKVAHDWFKPVNLRSVLEARVGELAKRFVDRMADLGDECDFARDVALLYPLHVIMSTLGVPESDEGRMLQLTQQLFGGADPEFGGEKPEEAVMKALMEFAIYFNEITQDRRTNPRDDIASTVANGQVFGGPMGDLETIGYYTIIATAGHDTTSSSITGGFEALLRNPDQLRLLQEKPELIDNAVDEMIRWVTPVRHFMRQAQEPVEVNGTKFEKGDWVLLSYLSANRDETVFDDPFRFDVTRENAEEHLAFGIGVHFCLGAHLARMEMKAFFRELLSRLESAEITANPAHTASIFVGGIKNLPIRYELRPAA